MIAQTPQWAEGDRVQWEHNRLYKGKVVSQQGKEVTVLWDDGAQYSVPSYELEPEEKGK